jgi:Cytochrome P460
MTRMKLTGLGHLALFTLVAACSSSSDAPSSDDQTPPTTGRADIESWLSAGSYKTWTSEAAIHEARSPSPHGFNRIYSNDVIAGAAAGTAAWPKGSAAVKEIYASATATTPVGFAVYLKTDADSAAGANWYWYERVPATSEAPHDANGVVADGKGGNGAAKMICVGCHAAAGSDADHTPSAGGRDQVYTPVH